MRTQEVVRKWIGYVVITLGCLLVQSVALNHVKILGVHPVLLPLLVCAVAAFEQNPGGLLFSLCLGVLADLTTTTAIPCFYTVTFVLSALIAIAIGHNLISHPFWCAVAASVAGLLAADLLYTVILIYRSAATFAGAARVAGCEMLISLPFALVLSWLVGRVRRKHPTN